MDGEESKSTPQDDSKKTHKENNNLYKEIENGAHKWTLATDGAVVNLLDNISKKLFSRCEEVENSFKDVTKQLDELDISLGLTSSNFKLLSFNQFVENRTQEEPNDFYRKTKSNHGSKNEKDAVSSKSVYKMAVNAGLEALKEACDRALTADSEPYTASINANLLCEEPLEYSKRFLPHIIGTDDFYNDSTLGLRRLDLQQFYQGRLFISSNSDEEKLKSNAVNEQIVVSGARIVEDSANYGFEESSTSKTNLKPSIITSEEEESEGISQRQSPVGLLNEESLKKGHLNVSSEKSESEPSHLLPPPTRSNLFDSESSEEEADNHLKIEPTKYNLVGSERRVLPKDAKQWSLFSESSSEEEAPIATLKKGKVSPNSKKPLEPTVIEAKNQAIEDAPIQKDNVIAPVTKDNVKSSVPSSNAQISDKEEFKKNLDSTLKATMIASLRKDLENQFSKRHDSNRNLASENNNKSTNNSTLLDNEQFSSKVAANVYPEEDPRDRSKLSSIFPARKGSNISVSDKQNKKIGSLFDESDDDDLFVTSSQSGSQNQTFNNKTDSSRDNVTVAPNLSSNITDVKTQKKSFSLFDSSSSEDDIFSPSINKKVPSNKEDLESLSNSQRTNVQLDDESSTPTNYQTPSHAYPETEAQTPEGFSSPYNPPKHLAVKNEPNKPHSLFSDSDDDDIFYTPKRNPETTMDNIDNSPQALSKKDSLKTADTTDDKYLSCNNSPSSNFSSRSDQPQFPPPVSSIAPPKSGFVDPKAHKSTLSHSSNPSSVVSNGGLRPEAEQAFSPNVSSRNQTKKSFNLFYDDDDDDDLFSPAVTNSKASRPAHSESSPGLKSNTTISTTSSDIKGSQNEDNDPHKEKLPSDVSSTKHDNSASSHSATDDDILHKNSSIISDKKPIGGVKLFAGNDLLKELKARRTASSEDNTEESMSAHEDDEEVSADTLPEKLDPNKGIQNIDNSKNLSYRINSQFKNDNINAEQRISKKIDIDSPTDPLVEKCSTPLSESSDNDLFTTVTKPMNSDLDGNTANHTLESSALTNQQSLKQENNMSETKTSSVVNKQPLPCLESPTIDISISNHKSNESENPISSDISSSTKDSNPSSSSSENKKESVKKPPGGIKLFGSSELMSKLASRRQQDEDESSSNFDNGNDVDSVHNTNHGIRKLVDPLNSPALPDQSHSSSDISFKSASLSCSSADKLPSGSSGKTHSRNDALKTKTLLTTDDKTSNSTSKSPPTPDVSDISPTDEWCFDSGLPETPILSSLNKSRVKIGHPRRKPSKKNRHSPESKSDDKEIVVVSPSIGENSVIADEVSIDLDRNVFSEKIDSIDGLSDKFPQEKRDFPTKKSNIFQDSDDGDDDLFASNSNKDSKLLTSPPIMSKLSDPNIEINKNTQSNRHEAEKELIREEIISKSSLTQEKSCFHDDISNFSKDPSTPKSEHTTHEKTPSSVDVSAIIPTAISSSMEDPLRQSEYINSEKTKSSSNLSADTPTSKLDTVSNSNQANVKESHPTDQIHDSKDSPSIIKSPLVAKPVDVNTKIKDRNAPSRSLFGNLDDSDDEPLFNPPPLSKIGKTKPSTYSSLFDDDSDDDLFKS